MGAQLLRDPGGSGRYQEESLWGQEVLPLSSGQDPDISGCIDFRPSGNCVEFVATLILGLVPQPRYIGENWETVVPRCYPGTRTPKCITAQPSALSSAKSGRVLETSAPGRQGSGQESGSSFDGPGRGPEANWGGGRLGWGPEFLFSPQAHLSSPLLQQGRNL